MYPLCGGKRRLSNVTNTIKIHEKILTLYYHVIHSQDSLWKHDYVNKPDLRFICIKCITEFLYLSKY